MSGKGTNDTEQASVPALVDALDVLGGLIGMPPPDSVDGLAVSVAEALPRHRDFDASEVTIAADAIQMTGSESGGRHSVAMPEGLDRRLAAEVHTIISENGLVYAESKLHRQADDLSGSLIGVPIMRGSSPIGSVIVWSADPDSLMPWHQHLLTMVANLFRLMLASLDAGKQTEPPEDTSGASMGVLPRTRSDDPSSVISGRPGIDALTGLPDRANFESHLQELLVRASRVSSIPFLLHIDIDRFRVVREFGGDLTAERLIRTFSELLRREMGGELLIGRLGMDQFGVAITRGSLTEAISAAEALVETVDALRLSFSGQRYDVSISIGVASLQIGAIGIVMAMRQALQACRAVQLHGGGAVQVYHRSFLRSALVPDDGRLLNLLTQALKEDALLLYAQPIAARAVSGDASETLQMHEILLRLRNTNGALVGAGELLPLAERYGLSAKLDRGVIKRAFAQIANSRFAHDPRHCFTLNLSGHSIDDHRLFDYISDQFALSGLPPQRICFEITETVAISDIGGASEFVDALRNIGCTFALDDFGSGRSSFLYLRDLSVDYLKIDGELVRDIATDPVSLSLVRTIEGVARLMGRKTIAEHVESQAINDAVTEIGCDYMQGFWVGCPVPLDELLRGN